MTQQGLGPGIPPPPPPPYNPWAAPASSTPPPRVINRLVVGLVVVGLGCAVLAGYGLGASHGHASGQGSTTPVTASHVSAPAPAPAPSSSAPSSTAPSSSAPSSTAPAPSSSDVTAHTPLTASSGISFFTDDFQYLSRGWDTGGDKHVMTRLVPHGFQTTIHGGWVDTVPSPNTDNAWQLGQSVTASLAKGYGKYSSMGLSCVRDYDKKNEMAYQFIVDSTGFWGVYRLNKANLDSSNPHQLASGHSTAAGRKAITIVVDCATLADRRTTRLAMFVNGAKVADLSNVAPKADEGWGGAMFNGGDDHATTVVTATHYSESILDTNTPIGTTA